MKYESVAAVAVLDLKGAAADDLEVTIESEAGGRPVCVAEFLMRLVAA